MASLFSAILAKYDGLAFAGFPANTVPPAYEDRAPEVQSGSQLYPPYVTFSLTAVEELLTFESDGIESYRLITTAYAATQADADTIAKAIRFNNQNPDQNAGFDNCSTLATLTEGVLQAIILTRPPSPNLAGRGREGALFYKTAMEHLVTVQRT